MNSFIAKFCLRVSTISDDMLSIPQRYDTESVLTIFKFSQMFKPRQHLYKHRFWVLATGIVEEIKRKLDATLLQRQKLFKTWFFFGSNFTSMWELQPNMILVDVQ